MEFYIENFELERKFCSPNATGDGKIGFDEEGNLLCGFGTCEPSGKFCVCDEGYEWDIFWGNTPICEWEVSHIDSVVVAMLIVGCALILLSLIKLVILLLRKNTTQREKFYGICHVFADAIWLSLPVHIWCLRRFTTTFALLLSLYACLTMNLVFMRKIYQVVIPLYHCTFKDPKPLWRALQYVTNGYLPFVCLLCAILGFHAEGNDNFDQLQTMSVLWFVFAYTGMGLPVAVCVFYMRRLEEQVHSMINSKNSMRKSPATDTFEKAILKIKRYRRMFTIIVVQILIIWLWFPLGWMSIGLIFPYKSRTSSIVGFFSYSCILAIMYILELLELRAESTSTSHISTNASGNPVNTEGLVTKSVPESDL